MRKNTHAFENIETHIALCIIPIQIDTDMSLTL